MSLLELERRLIRDAQRELAPAPAVRERHELALLARLGRELPGAGDAAMRGVGRAAASGAPGFAGLPARMLGVGLAVGALLGGWVGYSLGQRTGPGPGAAAVVSSPPAGAAAPAESPTLPTPEPPLPLAPEPAAPPGGGAPDATAEPGAVSAAASTPSTPGSSAAGRPPRRAAPSAPHAADSSLAEELAMLQRARRALGAGNAPLALGIVQELDERFPRGVLLEERLATRVLGLCALQRVVEAREVGRDFLARYASSVYADRVRASCLETRE